MLQIGKTIISLDVLEKHFICDIQKCKGMCCVYGDSGAPLEEGEPKILERIFNSVKGFLREEGLEVIKSQGTHIIDSDGDLVTPLINNTECAYVIYEDGITKCGIEKAYYTGMTDFIKPISCHLFPLRITKYLKYDAVNYTPVEQCNSAKKLGERKMVPVYEFLKDALLRKYGEAWFKKLKIAAESYSENGKYFN